MTGKIMASVLFWGMMTAAILPAASAQAASIHTVGAVLRADLSSGASGSTLASLRLRRGILRQGHLRNHRTVRITAYDQNGQVMLEREKPVSKRQTYARIVLPESMSLASRIVIALD